LVTPDFLRRVEALKAEINAGKFGALPAKRDDIEPFLKTQVSSREF
jgi:hypothetical protein